MKMKHLACTIACLLTATSATAVELSNDGKTKFELGGWVGIEYSHNLDDSPYNLGFNSSASRLFFAGSHNVSDDLNVYGKLEYALGFSDVDDAEFTTRLGYIGFQTNFGAIEAGKVWSTFYDIAQYSDTTYSHKDTASGAFFAPASEIGGFGRADNSVKYANRFDVSSGTILLGAIVGDQNGIELANGVSIDTTYGGSLRYAQGGLQFGVAHQAANATGLSASQDRIEATIFGAMYNSPSFLIGANYTIGSNNQYDQGARPSDLVDSDGIEGFAHYRFAGSYKAYAGYNQLTTANDNYTTDFINIGIIKNFDKKFAIYSEYRIDNGSSTNSLFHGDALSVGMMFFFSDYPQYW